MLFGLYVRRAEVDQMVRHHLRTTEALIRERDAAQREARDLRLQLITRHQFEAQFMENKYRAEHGIPKSDLEPRG